MNIGFISLGCAKNQVDSEEVIAYLKRNGAQMTQDPSQADIIMINTCAFIEPAKKEAIDTILEMAKYNKPLVVLGCFAQRYGKLVAKDLPEVKLWVPFGTYSTLGEQLKKVFPNLDFIGEVTPTEREFTSPNFEAYLRIAEGCNDFCAFCAIPYIRGRFRSVPLATLEKEMDKMDQEGIRSVTVIAQDTSMYGRDIHSSLTELVDKLLQHKNFEFCKLMYLYPDEIPDSLIDFYATKGHALTPYFDLPLQHAADHVLKRMYRRGTKQSYIGLLDKVRAKVPNIVLRTTMMVGFPGETDEDFNELLEFIEKEQFDHLGAFMYNQEEGTPAARFEDQIPAKVKRERYEALMKLQAGISYKLNKARIGKHYKVLIQSFDEKSMSYRGVNDLYAPDDIDGTMYVFSSEPLNPGDLVEVEVVNASIYDLDAKVTKVLERYPGKK